MNNVFIALGQNEQRQITGGSWLPRFIKELIKKLLGPTDGPNPDLNVQDSCPDSLGSVIMDGDTLIIYSKQLF